MALINSLLTINQCLLNIPHKEIEEIELLDKELKKDLIDEKTGILDVKEGLKIE